MARSNRRKFTMLALALVSCAPLSSASWLSGGQKPQPGSPRGILPGEGAHFRHGKAGAGAARQLFHTAESPADALLHGGSQHLPSVYAVALAELKDLESEPFCHRVAARLLVNNCQLLDGKDDATVLMESGRRMRDFVDSYAASLAICDLERGNFQIPRQCSRFREETLSKLPAGPDAHLHVSSKEIDQCLTGLAQSILLYEKLVQVIAKLATGVEAEMQQRMEHFDSKIKQTGEQIDSLGPLINTLREKLTQIEEQYSANVAHKIERSAAIANSSLESATNLEQTIKVMLDLVLGTSGRIADAHEKQLETVKQRTHKELETFMTSLAAVTNSATQLNYQLEASKERTVALAHRQDRLKEGLEKLEGIGNKLSDRYGEHARLLTAAQNLTDDIVETLLEAASSAEAVNSSFLAQRGSGQWWPYVICPVASLVMGSYGLPPSVTRNLVLIAFGELTGYLISTMDDYKEALHERYQSFIYADDSPDGIRNTAAPDMATNYSSFGGQTEI